MQHDKTSRYSYKDKAGEMCIYLLCCGVSFAVLSFIRCFMCTFLLSFSYRDRQLILQNETTLRLGFILHSMCTYVLYGIAPCGRRPVTHLICVHIHACVCMHMHQCVLTKILTHTHIHTCTQIEIHAMDRVESLTKIVDTWCTCR